MLLKRLLIALLLGCAGATAMAAQTVAVAQISGIVRDDSGGVLPGVEVTVMQVETGAVRTVFTNEHGAYVLPNLPVGPYRLTVTLQGFNTYVQEGIVLQVQTNPTIDIRLSVGTVNETVTVSAATAMVETRSTGVGQVIDNQRVVEMPLNGRQATELIFLSGLATSAPAGDLNTNKNYPTVTISVAGGQANGMTFIMDGATHNDPFNNLNLPTPFPDALQEFKVETSALPARYGHHAASAVNVITKAGTNSISGSAFEFLRNYHFNARNALATQRDTLERNQFGGVVGGPILRNKLFYFGGYQGTIENSNPPEVVRYVPTAAMRAGDFTTFASPQCNGGRQITLGAPFVNNSLAASQLNPVSVAMLQYMPVADDPCGRTQFGIPNNSDDHQLLGKVDYNFSSRQTMQARYLYARYDNPATYDGRNVLTLSRTGQTNSVHSVVAGHNFAATTSLFNSIRATYIRTFNDRSLPEYFTATELGSNISSLIPGYVGVAVNGNGFTFGSGATNPGYFNSEGFQLADDVDLVKGNHQITFGGNWIHTNIETNNNRPTNGAFTFTGQNTGLPLADFMAGSVFNFLQGNPVYDYQNHDYVGAYVQDEWRIRSDLTLNAGIRWEPFNPLQATFGWASHYDQARFDQGLTSQAYPQAPAGLVFPGDADYPGNGVSRQKLWNFAPRLGVIWQPTARTSVRAAWGIFADTPHLFFNTRFSNNPPWGAQLTITNPPGGFSDPYRAYPGGNPFPELNTDWATTAFPAFGVYVNAPLDLQPQRLQQWNLTVQQQVGDWMFGASYLGNHTDNLWRATELNPAVYGAGATAGNTNQRRELYLQNPAQGQFYGTLGEVDDTGRATYHGLLLTAQRRLKNNLSVLSNWTVSKCMSDPATTEITGPTIMNPDNPDADYSYCASDRRHVVNLSVVVQTPDFTGDVTRALFSDWQVSPIIRWQSGNRSTITLGTDVALTGMAGQRPNQVLDDPYGNGSSSNYLNRAAFAAPATGTYGTLEPFSIVNPSRFQNDLAITRMFNMGETRLQFRWEIFNVANYVNLDAPVTALNAANFGQILTAGDPRIMQFALKVLF